MKQLMVTLRSFAFAVSATFWTLLFAPLIPLLTFAGRPGSIIRTLTRVWASGILGLIFLLAEVRYSVKGRLNVPEEPALIIVNHQSAWETIAALVLFPDVAIVTKRELLALPVIGWFLRHSPMIPIDRGQSASALRDMLAACRKEVTARRSVLIFPEGTRKPPGSPIEFKRGVELLYRSLAVPTLVVAHNAGNHWQNGMRLQPGQIDVSILPPLVHHEDPATAVEQMRRSLEIEVAVLDQR